MNDRFVIHQTSERRFSILQREEHTGKLVATMNKEPWKYLENWVEYRTIDGLDKLKYPQAVYALYLLNQGVRADEVSEKIVDFH